MNPEKWKRFKKIVTGVLEQEPNEWPSYLFNQCGDDVDLFLDASSMLATSRSMGDFIESPAWHALLLRRDSAS